MTSTTFEFLWVIQTTSSYSFSTIHASVARNTWGNNHLCKSWKTQMKSVTLLNNRRSKTAPPMTSTNFSRSMNRARERSRKTLASRAFTIQYKTCRVNWNSSKWITNQQSQIVCKVWTMKNDKSHTNSSILTSITMSTMILPLITLNAHKCITIIQFKSSNSKIKSKQAKLN